jgi:hypothetical protein
MTAKGAIRQPVEWKDSRKFFYWRVKLRLMQDDLVKKLREADKRLSNDAALAQVKKWATDAKVDGSSDEAMCGWLEGLDAAQKLADCRKQFLQSELANIQSELATGVRGSPSRTQTSSSSTAAPAPQAPAASGIGDALAGVNPIALLTAGLAAGAALSFLLNKRR